MQTRERDICECFRLSTTFQLHFNGDVKYGGMERNERIFKKFFKRGRRKEE
jgi:hypothetical protein